uniref:arylamine N-acetyltransferase n=1 Tax=Oncorhynchus tshawytscha TaxID=74940 RepID=A0A8C8F7Q5_ONCTS
MNLEEYFKRIGFHGPFSKPDLETLNQVHKHHVMSIPFENLSIHCGEKITMDHELMRITSSLLGYLSFGVSSQIWYPLELVSGKDQPQSPDVFHLIQDGDLWKLEKTGRKPLVLNEVFTNSPLSLFTNKSICSLQKATGFRALIGWTFSEVTYNNQDGFDVFDMKDISVDDVDNVLNEMFNV